jgi:hypothetical protein
MRARIIHECGCVFEVDRNDPQLKEHTEMHCARHGAKVKRVEYLSDQRPETKEGGSG